MAPQVPPVLMDKNLVDEPQSLKIHDSSIFTPGISGESLISPPAEQNKFTTDINPTVEHQLSLDDSDSADESSDHLEQMEEVMVKNGTMTMNLSNGFRANYVDTNKNSLSGPKKSPVCNTLGNTEENENRISSKVTSRGRKKDSTTICKTCEFVGKDKSDFYAHLRKRVCFNGPLFECEFEKCDFCSRYKHHFEYHQRNHYGSKPFKCDQCNYSCVNQSMLNSHTKSHSSQFPYRCKTCTYATKYLHSIKLHVKKYNHELDKIHKPDATRKKLSKSKKANSSDNAVNHRLSTTVPHPSSPSAIYHQNPSPPSAIYHQNPSPSSAIYHQNPSPPSAYYHMNPSLSSANYHQTPSPPSDNYLQTPSPPRAIHLHNPSSPSTHYHQNPSPLSANYHQSPALLSSIPPFMYNNPILNSVAGNRFFQPPISDSSMGCGIPPVWNFKCTYPGCKYAADTTESMQQHLVAHINSHQYLYETYARNVCDLSGERLAVLNALRQNIQNLKSRLLSLIGSVSRTQAEKLYQSRITEPVDIYGLPIPFKLSESPIAEIGVSRGFSPPSNTRDIAPFPFVGMHAEVSRSPAQKDFNENRESFINLRCNSISPPSAEQARGCSRCSSRMSVPCRSPESPMTEFGVHKRFSPSLNYRDIAPYSFVGRPVSCVGTEDSRCPAQTHLVQLRERFHVSRPISISPLSMEEVRSRSSIGSESAEDCCSPLDLTINISKPKSINLLCSTEQEKKRPNVEPGIVQTQQTTKNRRKGKAFKIDQSVQYEDQTIN